MKQPFNVELTQLRTLCAVADHGTVTAAAAALHLSPSAVSQQVAALSRAADAALLARHGRRVQLTPAARILVEHARTISAELERASSQLAALADGEAGTVSLVAFGTAINGLVIPALADLSKTRPGLVVHVEEVEAPDCFGLLDDGRADVAVTVDYAGGPHRSDARYERVELLTDPLLAVLPRQHPLAAVSRVPLNALADQPWVLGTPGHPCVDITRAVLAAASITPATVHRIDDWRAVVTVVAHGHGVALVPALALPRNLDGAVARPLRGIRPGRTIYAALRRGSAQAPHLTAVTTALAAAAQAAGVALPGSPAPKGRREASPRARGGGF